MDARPVKRFSVARMAGLGAALLAGAPARPARALLLTLNPRATVGVTNNAYGAPQDQSTNQYRDEYYGGGGSVGLLLNLPRSNHRLGYGFNTTRYLSYHSADVTSHDGVWTSTFNLTSHTTLGLGASASVFRTSAVLAIDPMMPNIGVVPFAQSPTTILTAGANQMLIYEPSGVEKYFEGLTAMLVRPLDQTGTVPELMQINTTLRRDRTRGRDTYSLSVLAGDFFRLDTPAGGAGASGGAVTGTVLGGWQRAFSARTATEIQAGVMAIYGTSANFVAIGPAGTASLSYQLTPWFATVTIAQQPSINAYVAEALVSDSATLRVSLPLNRRDSILISGFSTYTYARRVTANSHFVFASRVYDLVAVGASLMYRLERWPIGMGLDYSLTSQRGSRADGRYYPSTARSVLGLSVTAAFGFGDGNAGWLRPR